MTGEFPSQRASNAENVSIWWRHHEQSPPLWAVYFSVVTLDDEALPGLIDPLNNTCVSFHSADLHQQTAHLVITRDHFGTVEVQVHGYGIVCAAEGCNHNPHPTVLLQQGRISGLCLPDIPLCLGASVCENIPTPPPSSTDDLVACQYRCTCPIGIPGDNSPCSKFVLILGSGSLATGNEHLEICRVSVNNVEVWSSSVVIYDL